MFCWSVFWALITLNLFFPRHDRPEWLSSLSFVFGFLTAELALHMMLIEIVIAFFLVWGGLEGFWDALGFVIALASWAGMAVFYLRGEGAKEDIEAGVRQALGDDYAEELPEAMRREHAEPIALSRIRNPFAYKHPEVKRIANVQSTVVDGDNLHLDIYQPRNKPNNAPVLVQIHGGGWVIGSKEQQGLVLMREMSRQGWVCVSLQYRLSPKVAFPEHIIDCKRGLAWVKQNIADYGGNPDFVVVTGGSAGGHLSSLLAYSGNDKDWQPGFEEVDTAVQGCVPFYGVYDFTNSQGQQKTEGLRNMLAKTVIQKSEAEAGDLWAKGSPLLRVDENAPPSLLIHGKADTLVPPRHSEVLLDALQKARGGKGVGYAEIRDAQHAFDLVCSLRNLYVVRGIQRYLTVLHQRFQAEKLLGEQV